MGGVACNTLKLPLSSGEARNFLFELVSSFISVLKNLLPLRSRVLAEDFIGGKSNSDIEKSEDILPGCGWGWGSVSSAQLPSLLRADDLGARGEVGSLFLVLEGR